MDRIVFKGTISEVIKTIRAIRHVYLNGTYGKDGKCGKYGGDYNEIKKD